MNHTIIPPRFASRRKQRGFIINPYNYASGGGGATDPYFSYVKVLSHMDSSSWVDVIGHTSANVGSPSLVAGDTGFSNAGDFTSGVSGVTWYPTSTEFDVGASTDFTLEFKAKSSNWGATQYIFDMHPASIFTNSADALLLYSLGSGQYRFWNGSDIGNVFYSFTNNVWYSLAITRQFDSPYQKLLLWVDGANVGAVVTTFTSTGGNVLTVGCDTVPTLGSPTVFDEIRYTVGVARYTIAGGSYTPATEPFPNS